jgi:hypothetical protein
MSSINREIKRLSKSCCANFHGESGCSLEPNGQARCSFFREDSQARPFIEAGAMRCGYFEKAVLPSDPDLVKRYFGQPATDDNRRKCDRCGEAFVGKSNAAKYCRICAGLVRRDSSREAKRKARANVSK